MRRYKGNIPRVANDNNTLLYLIIILLFTFLLFIIPFHHWNIPVRMPTDSSMGGSPPTVLNNVNISSRNERLDDPYFPPVYTYPYLGYETQPVISSQPVVAMPINIKTQGVPSGYQQVGILTASSEVPTGADGTLILPLMGRLTMRNRQKWQYYTIANGVGSINTKLPVYSGKRPCMSENGCDEIISGDTLYVQGYNKPFIATVYDNQTLEYLPVII